MNEVDARMRAVDERLPQRFAASTYRPDAWTIRLIGGGWRGLRRRSVRVAGSAAYRSVGWESSAFSSRESRIRLCGPMVAPVGLECL